MTFNFEMDDHAISEIINTICMPIKQANESNNKFQLEMVKLQNETNKMNKAINCDAEALASLTEKVDALERAIIKMASCKD